MNTLNEKQMKDLYFEGLFEQKVVRYKTERDGKFMDVVQQCNNQAIQNFINKLYSKYKIKHSFADYMMECMYHTNVAIQRFNIRDEGTWESIIDGTDKANIGRLISNIKATLEHQIVEFNNFDVKRTTTSENGETRHVKYKFAFTSLDSVMMDADGNSTSLIQTVGNESNFYGEKQGYQMNEFMTWFHENKERVLTKSQLNLLRNLEKCSHQKDGMTENDVEAVTGVPSFKINTYLNRIKERTLKAWNKEKTGEGKSLLEMEKEAEIQLYTPLIDIIYSEETVAQNKLVSDWIIANIDNEKVSNIVYDNLVGAEAQAVTHAYVNKGKQTIIPSQVLYKIISKVEERLDYLQQLETTSVKFYKKPEEMGRWTPEAHKAFDAEQKAWKEQPCYVYNKDGELTGTLPYKKTVKKHQAVYQVTPTGVHTQIDTAE
jgi:hypothetical protein